MEWTTPLCDNQKRVSVRLLVSVLCGLMATTLPAIAQKNIVRQDLYWIRYFARVPLSSRLEWQQEFDKRQYFVNHRHHHFITHGRLHYNVSNRWQVAGGLTYSLQSPSDPYLTIRTKPVPELRPVQEVSYSIAPSPNLGLHFRLRTDERFFLTDTGTDFVFRHRYRGQVSYQFKKIETTLRFSNELHLNAGREGLFSQLDQNRIYVSVDKKVRPNVSIEVGYLNWYQPTRNNTLYYQRDILRLSIHHTFVRNAATVSSKKMAEDPAM